MRDRLMPIRAKPFDYERQTTIVMVLLGMDRDRAEVLLKEEGGHISALAVKA